MKDRFWRVLFGITGLVTFGLLIGILLIIFGTLRSGKEVIVINAGAREAFEAHLAALDDGDWELANTYFKDGCIIGFAASADDPAEALQQARDSGFSFSQSFQIEEVWFSEDGTEAVLGLRTPPDLPDITTLELVEGEWLVTC